MCFLMEMFFLSYVNGTMYLLWNLSFFKMAPPKTNFFSFLKSWTDNSSTDQYSYQLFYGWGITHLCHPISKMYILGEGPGETPSALRCLYYLINSFLFFFFFLLLKFIYSVKFIPNSTRLDHEQNSSQGPLSTNLPLLSASIFAHSSFFHPKTMS